MALNGECNIDAAGTIFYYSTFGALETRNVGSEAGLTANNLHVFNASAVSFNYLIGHQTTAQTSSDAGGSDQTAAWGIDTWRRPAIADIGYGDGLPAPIYRVLMGSEPVRASDTTTWLLSNAVSGADGGAAVITSASPHVALDVPNFFYLRNEVHGGTVSRWAAAEAANNIGLPHSAYGSGASNTDDSNPGSGAGINHTLAFDQDASVGVGGIANYGALGWTAIHGPSPATPVENGFKDQRVEFLSIADDYNGSKTASSVTIGAGVVYDRSYNIVGAQTGYTVQVYDNNEDQLSLTPDTPINISPPPSVPTTANLRIIVECLQVWINGTKTEEFRRDGLSIYNLHEITALVTTGNGDFDGLGFAVNPLTDASQGWIRFARDNVSNKVSATLGTQTVTVTGGTIAPVNPVIMDNLGAPSFTTIGQTVLKYVTETTTFGASWWLNTVPVYPAVNNAALHNPSP